MVKSAASVRTIAADGFIPLFTLLFFFFFCLCVGRVCIELDYTVTFGSGCCVVAVFGTIEWVGISISGRPVLSNRKRKWNESLFDPKEAKEEERTIVFFFFLFYFVW